MILSSESVYEAVADGAVLLTVNRRLARHHAHRYGLWQGARGALWWETPRILPWPAWLAEVHDAALAAGLSTKVRVPAIVQQRFWRRALGRDAAEALLDPDAAAREAARARQIGCAWSCLGEPGDYLSHDQLAWRRWAGRYAARCEREGLVDDAVLAEHVAELVRAHVGDASLALPERLLLAGFLQLNPQQRALLDTLAAVGIGVERLVSGNPGAVRRDVHDDDGAELRHVADEVRLRLERDPAGVLGVVVPDLGARRTVVRRAFDRAFFPGLTPDEIEARGRPYDLSLGLPLADQALVRTALSLLRLLLSGVAGGELSALLLSPYVAGAAGESRRREQLDRELRERRVHALGLAALCRELGPASELAKAGRRLLRERERGRALPSLWAARFGAALHALGWPGERSDSDEYQAVQAWHGCLRDLQMLDDDERIGEREALGLVARLARERVFQPETPPVPVQVMGRLESHGIGFDRLWVTGLDADTWPPSGSPSPFLPIARQKASGVPEASAAERLALAEREFALWRASTPALVASHVRERDGRALAPAAVLAETTATAFADDAPPPGPPGPPGTAAPFDPLGAVMAAAHVASERLVDERGPPLAAGTDVRGGARLLEDQALCPFRAFALHRLHVRPLEEVGIGLDPRQHGNLLHRALESFWTAVRTHAALVAMDAEALAAAIDVATARALDESTVSGPLRELERRRLVRLLGDWIALCERPRTPFEVVAFEAPAEIERGGLRLQVKLDRIDRVGTSRVILDYKTGTSSSIAPWSEDRITAPQLPLYALGDESIEGASFAQVVRHGCTFAGVASEAALLPKAKVASGGIEDWAGWRRHWAEALDRVAAEVRAGEARVAPRANACTHCELKPLCRVDTRRALPVDTPSAPGTSSAAEAPAASAAAVTAA